MAEQSEQGRGSRKPAQALPSWGWGKGVPPYTHTHPSTPSLGWISLPPHLQLQPHWPTSYPEIPPQNF